MGEDGNGALNESQQTLLRKALSVDGLFIQPALLPFFFFFISEPATSVRLCQVINTPRDSSHI